MKKLSGLNEEQKATILMVTHDPNAASYCSRILFIQDGMVFHELRRRVPEESQEAFYERILKGESGRVVAAKNAKGTDMPFKYEQRYEAKDGDGIVLTIDEVLQHFLEKHLEVAVKENGIKISEVIQYVFCKNLMNYTFSLVHCF